MTPRLRDIALTAHIASSVGWLGAVAAFLALAAAGLAGRDPERARAAYLAIEVVTWWVIVPLAFASLATGTVMAVGTPWGLFQHYWVLAKLLLSAGATIVLLLHTGPIGVVAGRAAETALAAADLRGLRIQLVADAGAALLVLLVNTGLSVFRPKGLIPAAGMPRWVKAAAIAAIVLVLAFVAAHLAGGGLHRH